MSKKVFKKKVSKNGDILLFFIHVFIKKISNHPRKSQFLFSTLPNSHFWMVLLHHFWFFLHPRFEKIISETIIALKKNNTCIFDLTIYAVGGFTPPHPKNLKKLTFSPIFSIFRLWSQPRKCVLWSYYLP